MNWLTNSTAFVTCNTWIFYDPWELGLQAQVEWEWRLRFAAVKLSELYDHTFRPLLLIFRRFDFRSAPRWRAQRWRAKT